MYHITMEEIDAMHPRYPILMRMFRVPTATSSFAQEGIKCGRGWIEILTALFDEAEAEATRLRRAGMAPEELPLLERVREHFGKLEVYISHASPKIQDAIMEAQAQADQACETCGEPGELRSHGWLTVLCDVHA